MKNKVIKLITQKISIFITISIFVNIIMIFAAKAYIEPSIEYTFNYVLNNLANEDHARLIFKQFAIGDPIQELVAIICLILSSLILVVAYVFSITLISALLAFKTVNGIIDYFLKLINFSLKREASLINEIKIIAKWIALYFFCNLMIQVLGFSGFIYNKLAILSQGAIFYLLFSNNPFNYNIRKIKMRNEHLNKKNINLVIRIAKISDIKTILPLIQQLGYPTSEEEFRLRFQKFTQNLGYGVAVASLDNQVVGWVAWSKSELLILAKTRFNIEGLVVDEQHRGKGIGKKLMAFVEEVASTFKPSVIDVTSGVRRAKEGTHEFYKRLGYKHDGPKAKIFFRKEL